MPVGVPTFLPTDDPGAAYGPGHGLFFVKVRLIVVNMFGCRRPSRFVGLLTELGLIWAMKVLKHYPFIYINGARSSRRERRWACCQLKQIMKP
jgi:hypothetical protein